VGSTNLEKLKKGFLSLYLVTTDSKEETSYAFK